MPIVVGVGLRRGGGECVGVAAGCDLGEGGKRWMYIQGGA